MTKITELGDAATPLADTDLVEVVQQVSSSPVNKKVPVSELGGGSVEAGTYLGTGVAWDTVITLSEPHSIVFVTATPSSGEVVQGMAIAGGPNGFRLYESAYSPVQQLNLAADGVTVTADGTGSLGLNESGQTYYYVAI